MEQTHFTIIIPAYNCSRWVEKNLNSAINQDYKNYHIVYINDASTDDTAEKARTLLDNSNKSFQLIENKKNRKALANLYDAVYASRPKTIIVALDGDDWLLNNKVLQKLNKIYIDESPWITSGAYIDNVMAKIHKPKISDTFWDENIRNQEWTLSHLRTFRRELFMKIDRADFMDLDGDFYKFTWDRVIMYPMIEMAGREKFRAISIPLYVYNRVNPLSVDRIHRKEQLRIEDTIRRKMQYTRATSL